jgi:hypothetical protein
MVWNESEERRQVKVTLAEMKATLSQKETIQDETALDSFAATFPVQLWTVLIRVFEQYWRTPSYLYSKTLLCTAVVGHSGSLYQPKKLIGSGSIHRILILEISNISSRNAEPAFLCFHASNDLWQSCSTDHAPLRYSARSLRGSGTTIKNLLLAGLYYF